MLKASAPEKPSTPPGDNAERILETTPTGRPQIPLGIVIVCLVLVALGLRPGIVSIGPILPGIIGDFALSYTQASLMTAIPTLLMGLLALVTPWLATRFGRDRVIIAALLVLALSTAGRAFSGSTAALFATTTGVGAGIAIAGALVPGFVKASLPNRVAMLMGVYATALSVGSTFAAGTTSALAQLFGTWRFPAGLWAIPVFVGIMAWLYVEKRGRVITSPAHATLPHRLPVRNVTAWLIAAFFAFNNLLFYSLVSWIAPLYVELGYSSTSAGLILSCFTFAFMAANPLFGIISRNEDRRLCLALGAGISFIGVVWMAIAPAFLPFAAVSLVAFGAGGAFTLAMTLPLDNARSDGEATAWNAFVLLVSYLVGAAGPVLVGFLRDTSGSFQVPLWLLVAASAAMLAITPLLQPHHHRLAAAQRRANRSHTPEGESR
ncbi:MFS transporter [Pseudomonas dryadis]|uniref:MFS transporter n=2 Tax=Phytopseudomonas dryadis TaxID=2487520 RepID=A0A4Q9R452_9GAMM|nr:MFS transporter [Pseudomonas dryadis]